MDRCGLLMLAAYVVLPPVIGVGIAITLYLWSLL